MKRKVYEIVSKIMNLPLDQINENSSPDTIEAWTSLKHMNLVLALEQEFGTTFTDEEILELMNVGVIIDTLNKNACAEG